MSDLFLSLAATVAVLGVIWTLLILCYLFPTTSFNVVLSAGFTLSFIGLWWVVHKGIAEYKL